MTEAQKEYIITEAELDMWQTVTPDSPMCQELRQAVRSRPYKSDAVLDVKDEWRKYILSFKDEDPLFMAFSDGYDYCKKELRSQQKER